MIFELPEKGDLVFYTKAGLKYSSAGAMPLFIDMKTPLLVLGFEEIDHVKSHGVYKGRRWLRPWKNKRWELHCLAATKIFHLVLYPKEIELKDMLIIVKASRKK